LKDLVQEVDQLQWRQFGGRELTFRIGVNSGPVVAGVIGHKKFIYDLWERAQDPRTH
jgi:class 3 adenylate cyclase